MRAVVVWIVWQSSSLRSLGLCQAASRVKAFSTETGLVAAKLLCAFVDHARREELLCVILPLEAWRLFYVSISDEVDS